MDYIDMVARDKADAEARELANAPHVPNFDAMTQTELMAVWVLCGMSSVKCPRKVAREWFPAQPKGYVRTAKTLGAYACNKSVAIGCRLKGDIAVALVYETICDRIYDGLPDYAKW